jgi:hypothetical protein
MGTMDTALHFPGVQSVRSLCCLAEPQAPHWLPDAQRECCSCGVAFDMFNRRHHCRCCGGIFCAACSSNRCSLPGWGIEPEVRTCDACCKFEVQQLPMLLAGDVWFKPGAWTGLANLRFVWLDADQSALLWAPWDDEMATADRQQPRRLEVSQAESIETTSAQLLIRSLGSKLVLEPDGVHGGERMLQAWAAALTALLAIRQERHRNERLYGGIPANAVASPRTIAISAPRLQHVLRLRQSQLTSLREDELATGLEAAASLDPRVLAREQAEREQREQKRKDLASLQARMRAKYSRAPGSSSQPTHGK